MSEEYGLDLEHLSAINMLMALGSDGLASDERFHIRGGNDQLVSGLATRLPAGTVVQDARLTSLVRHPNGRYRLGFRAHPRARRTSSSSARRSPPSATPTSTART
jgi:monoamine oxidase